MVENRGGGSSGKRAANRAAMSLADSREKVRFNSREAGMPLKSWAATRLTSTVVLPEPGTASKRSGSSERERPCCC